MKKSFLLAILLLLVAAAGVMAVAPEAENASYGGVLRIGGTDLNTLDVQAVSQSRVDEFSVYFYETLVERTNDNSISPLLLESWEQDEDGVTSHWKIREGVKFHNGEELTAEIVKWNLERKINESLPKANLIPWAEEGAFTVTGDYTMDVKLARPFLGMYEILAQQTFSMYSPKFVEEVGNDGLKTQACGTGPFVVSEYSPNEKLVMTKNTDYWQEGLPYLDGVEITVIPDLNTRSFMLEAGDLDMILDISTAEYSRLSETPGVKAIADTSSRAFYGALDSYDGPLAEKAVRQAINYAIDKESMIDPIFDGMVTLNRSFVLTPTSIGYYANEPYAYDPEKAKSLLEEAGWVDSDGDGVREKDGQKLELILLNREGSYQGDTEIPVILQAELGEIGINVKINTVDAATFVTSLNKPREEVPDYDIIYFSTSTSSGFARDTMKTIMRCDAWPPTYWNYGWYCNPEFDALVDKADLAATQEEANEYLAEAQRIIWEDAAAIFFFDGMSTVAVGENVEGLISLNTTAIWSAKYAYFNK